MFGEDDLLLGALDSSCEVMIVGLLEFLACLSKLAGPLRGPNLISYNITELCLCNQALSLRADQFLFKLDDLSALRFLVLQLGDLI